MTTFDDNSDIFVDFLISLAEILENYRHTELLYNSGQKMELDIFLPKEQLGFEYQGIHHYRDIYALGSGWDQQNRDREKREKCKESGITLIVVPYWWDNKLPSLMATIHQQWTPLNDPTAMAGHISDQGVPIQLPEDILPPSGNLSCFFGE
jgi:hypothetical protein